MAKECAITGKSIQFGGGYSNRTRATKFNPIYKRGKRVRKANLQKRRIFVPELKETLTLWLSKRGLKTIQKKGAYRALKDVEYIK